MLVSRSEMRAKIACAARLSRSIVAVKRVIPRAARGVGQREAQPAAEPLALEGVGDDDRRLGGAGSSVERTKRADGDDVLALDGDQRDVVDAVDLGQVAQVLRRQPRLGREVAPAHRLGRQARVRGGQLLGVGGADGPDEGMRGHELQFARPRGGQL